MPLLSYYKNSTCNEEQADYIGFKEFVYIFKSEFGFPTPNKGLIKFIIKLEDPLTSKFDEKAL